jgi:4-hydroxymandelate synthase
MNIEDIDHVEFYVGDAPQAAFFLCAALGFRLCGQAGPETGLSGQRSLLLRQGGIQLVLTSDLTGTGEVGAYVARHGDGVAVVALNCEDARDAYRAAVSRGATPVAPPAQRASGHTRVVTAAVSGFGDVAHRFVERHGDPACFMPEVMENLAADGPDTGEDLVTEIDHVAVCVGAGELDATVRYYQQVFGFRQIFEEHIEVGAQAMNSKVIQSPSEQVTLTLLEPDASREPGQIDEFLHRNQGAGVQHLAFLADDIVGAVDRFEQRGVRFLATPDSYYESLGQRVGTTDIPLAELRRTNVLVDRDHWGEVFQIFTQSMHVRRTYFMEIIERRGARTFGTGNIKALYQAVERERAAVPA